MLSSQLCASGTVGVAAAGLAFGRPQHSIAARPTSNKRRATPSTGPTDVQNQSIMPATPSPLQPSTSAPTSRLRKRASAGRPVSSGSNLKGGTKTLERTLDGKIILENDVGRINQPSLHLQQSRQSVGGRSFTLEYPGSENVQPSWLQRKSTLSSLKSGSPATTERPGSSSITYSNGSAAPIFPRDISPSTPSRNRLVKRSSSQRALDGSSGLHSTLRRPATSHQRSATLQRRYMADNEVGQRSSFVPSIFDRPASEPQETYGSTTQVWRPFFKPHVARPGRDGPSRKRNALGATSRVESFKSVVPDISELPILVMATSISTRSSHEDTRRASNVSAFSRPFTPVGWRNYDTPSSNEKDVAAMEPNPRNSFSITDMFPSPSPATWKMPRTGSLRNKKSFARTGGRRIVSAPQSSKSRPVLTTMQGSNAIGDKATDAIDADPYASPLVHKSGPMRGYQVPPSSPLPTLNRLSAFDVNLPETVPSYPTSPLAEDLPPSRNFSPISSPSLSSQIVLSGSRNQSHRPSGALSDHTSTLLGSENDNSRLMSGDEEDLDLRSETVFDSTRTAATGTSLAGLKRPPIETIFDESPSSDFLPNNDAIAVKEPLAYVPVDQTHHTIPTEIQNTSPVLIDHSSKEEDEMLTRMQKPSQATSSAQDPSSSISAPLKLSSVHRPSDEMVVSDDEALWSFDHVGDGDRVNADPRDRGMTSDGRLAFSPRTREHTPKRRQSPPTIGADRSSKGNIFEWSEHLESEISPGGSPRPKTVHGRQGRDNGGSRPGGRRGPSALHLRSQSVPVPNENRVHNNPHAKLESWMLGNKGPSEDWDGDFDFEDPSPRGDKQGSSSNEPMRTSLPSGMLVPQAILERQATVHSQFGQVKELTLLVEELKRLQQQASVLDIMTGQSIELWKEAEGIINLATLNDEEDDLFPPRSPRSPGGFDFEAFNEDSPSNRQRRSGLSPPIEDRLSTNDDASTQASSRPSQELSYSNVHTPPASRPRKESSAKAKSVLETIHQQRSNYDPALLGDAGMVHKKLPFDTTSLKDLVTRAGVVTRALKEIVRRAEGVPATPEPQDPSTRKDPPDPPFSQMFQNPPPSPSPSKAARVPQSPKSLSPKGSKSPKSPKGSPYLGGGSIAGNDNEINGHMKMMTVV